MRFLWESYSWCMELKMRRREFLKIILTGAFFPLLAKKAFSENKYDVKLKKAMFWKKVDSK